MARKARVTDRPELTAEELPNGDWRSTSGEPTIIIPGEHMKVYLGEAESVPEEEKQFVGWYELIQE
jgi:hypothetical protein